MSEAPARPPAPRKRPADVLIPLLGALYMALLAFGAIMPPEYPFIGTRLYDLYAQALLDGRFDLPLMELRFEGHYTPDGTGYLYHGIGPVLARLPFADLAGLPAWWSTPLSIWFWSVLGNALYHRAFLSGLEASPAVDGVAGRLARTLLALLVWFGAPGLLLAANGSLFYEPVAMAYALGGGFVLLIVRAALGRIAIERALLPLAVLAGLTVHARPHLAVGYYAAVCLIAAIAFLRGGKAVRVRAVAALGVLGLFGGALLAINALRFDNAAVMHGSFDKSEVQYGMIYWGVEDAESERAEGFRRFGQFNAARVAPNGAMYIAALPYFGFTDSARKAVEALFRKAEPWTGHVRIEGPNVGTVFLWPLWMLLMAAGLRQRALWRMPALAGMAGAATGSLLLFAYATITLRYHVDMWPAIALPAAFGIGPVLARARASAPLRLLLMALLLLGIVMTATMVGRSRGMLAEAPGLWTPEFCRKLTAGKGFPPERGVQLCRTGTSQGN